MEEGEECVMEIGVRVCVYQCCIFVIFFFFNDTATTEIYTLSLHDALPILNTCNDKEFSAHFQ